MSFEERHATVSSPKYGAGWQDDTTDCLRVRLDNHKIIGGQLGEHVGHARARHHYRAGSAGICGDGWGLGREHMREQRGSGGAAKADAPLEGQRGQGRQLSLRALPVSTL
jgi:hypothetical protein